MSHLLRRLHLGLIAPSPLDVARAEWADLKPSPEPADAPTSPTCGGAGCDHSYEQHAGDIAGGLCVKCACGGFR